MKIVSICIALILLTNPSSADDVHQSTVSHVHPAQATSKSEPTRGGIASHKADRIVVYSASWCAPCQRLKPILLSLKQQGYKVEYLDVDKDVSKLIYSHKSVPTIYYLRGEVVIKQESGYRSKEQIVRMLDAKRNEAGDKVAPLRESSDTAMNLVSKAHRS